MRFVCSYLLVVAVVVASRVVAGKVDVGAGKNSESRCSLEEAGKPITLGKAYT
jgi:hypothetical protein